MVLVDTSVLIGYFRGSEDDKTRLFAEILRRDIPFGISPYTYQEILQGARNEQEFETLRTYLATQKVYTLASGLDTHEQAARMYFDLRRRGLTVRSTMDVLIALTAIQNDLLLLHNDRDFDIIERHDERIKSLKAL